MENKNNNLCFYSTERLNDQIIRFERNQWLQLMLNSFDDSDADRRQRPSKVLS